MKRFMQYSIFAGYGEWPGLFFVILLECISNYKYARVAKWQTHYLEVVATARSWEFDSPLGHQNLPRTLRGRFLLEK